MVVVDTHVLLWWLSAPAKLSKKARRALTSSKRVGVAAISTWEVAMLAAKGRIRLDRPALEWLHAALATPRVEVLPLTPSIAVHSSRFAAGDPADRLIAATAIVEGVPLVTADERVAALPGLEVIWD